MSGWRAFWAEVRRPSGLGETPYQWALIAAGHFLIGEAAGALVLPWLGWAAGAGLVVVAYWSLKEATDLRVGGRLADGLADAGFVALGALAAAAPAVTLAAVGGIAIGIGWRGVG